MLSIIAGLCGGVCGSFANVCVPRIPRGESVAYPASRCPACNHAIAWYDNISGLAFPPGPAMPWPP